MTTCHKNGILYQVRSPQQTALNRCAKQYTRKGIQIMKMGNGISVPSTQETVFNSSRLQFREAFAIKINGSWYHIQHDYEGLFNKTNRNHADLAKRLEIYGNVHRFAMKRMPSIECALPDAVRKFVEKHLRDGSVEGCLITHNNECPPPSTSKEGWQS